MRVPHRHTDAPGRNSIDVTALGPTVAVVLCVEDLPLGSLGRRVAARRGALERRDHRRGAALAPGRDPHRRGRAGRQDRRAAAVAAVLSRPRLASVVAGRAGWRADATWKGGTP